MHGPEELPSRSIALVAFGFDSPIVCPETRASFTHENAPQ